jgi:CPA1 family monovalent cation:H+ antiporter
VGSIALGLAIGWAFSKLAERIADPVISVSASFLVAFGTYLAAIAIHVSGVLAVVTAGLFFAWRAPRVLTPDVRLSSTAFWKIAIFILNALAFVLIGLQLPEIIKDLPKDYTVRTLAIDAGVIAGTVILVRLVWVVGVSQFLRWIGGAQARREIGDWREAVVIGWSGMRGLISLAAALALPETIDNGQPFPARALILFLAFAVILATLVIQGLSLGTVIRMLRIEGDPDGEREERLARTEATHAALAAIERLTQAPGAMTGELDHLRLYYVTRLGQWADDDAEDPADPRRAEFADAVRLATVAAERQAVLDLRHRRIIGDEALHQVQSELDLIESAVRRRRPGYSPTTWIELARRSAQSEPSTVSKE